MAIKGLPETIDPSEILPSDKLIKPGNAITTLSPEEEVKFQQEYLNLPTVKSGSLNSDPDDPEHFYDWRAAWKAGKLIPDDQGHFSSEFKLEGHPRMVLDGVNTKTGLEEPSEDQFVDTSLNPVVPPVNPEPQKEKKYEAPKEIDPKDILPTDQIVKDAPIEIDPSELTPEEVTLSGKTRFTTEKDKDGNEHIVLTREAWEEEVAGKPLLEKVAAIPSGLLGVREQIQKGGQDIVDARYPIVANIRNALAKKILPEGALNVVEKVAGVNLHETPEEMGKKKIKPLSVIEGVAQLPEMVVRAAEGTGDIAQKTLNNPIGMGDEEGKEANKEISYRKYIENAIEGARRSEGKSILGDVASAIGMDREFLDKNIDQNQAGLFGLMADPTFLASGAGKGIQILMKAGKFKEASRLLKLAQEGKLAKAAEGAIPPLLPEGVALETALKAAPKKAPAGAIPPVIDADNVVAETIGNMTKKGLQYGKDILETSPSTAAVNALGKTLDLTGRGTTKLLEVIEKNPIKAGFLIGTGESLLEGKDIPDSLKFGAMASLGAWTGMNIGADRLMRKLGTYSDNVSVAGKTLGGLSKAMEAPGTRSLAKAAKGLAEGSKEQRLLKAAAIGGNTLEEIGEPITAMEKLAGRMLRAGVFVGPEIVDPAIRGSLIGGGIEGLASGGDVESTFAGVGAGAGIGPLGYATGKILTNGRYNPKNDALYVSMRLAEKSENVRNRLTQAIKDRNIDLQSVAHMLEIDDMIKPGDASIEYLSNDEFIKEIQKKHANYDPNQIETPRGWFVKEEDSGKKRIFVNLDNFDSSTLPHEAFHFFQGLGKYKGFGKGDKPIGDDLLSAARNDFFTEIMGNQEMGIKGIFTEEDLQKMHEQYYDKLGIKAPVFGPLERTKILEEIWADAGGQLMERARLNSGNEGALEYARRLSSMSEDQVDAMLNRLERTSTGSRNLGDSALFKDVIGKRIRNTAKMEKALADFVLTMEGSSGRSAPGEGRVNEVKVSDADLVSQVDKAIAQRREGTYANDVTVIDEANKKIIDMAKMRIYKTKPKPPAQVLNEARERANRIYGKENVTQTEIDLSLPFIPEEDILNTSNLPMQPGDRPQLLTASDRKKLTTNLVNNIFTALEGKSAPDKGKGLFKISSTDGEPRYVGSHITDEQMAALMSVDPKSLPKGLRGLIQNLNESMKNRTGQIFNGVYFKNIEKKGNIRKSYRLFTPTSWQITKNGNVAVTAFDVGTFYKTLRDLATESPDSPLLRPFIESDDTNINQAVKRFQDAVIKYNANHSKGRPGAADLNADAGKAEQMRNAINGFFGISDKDANPMATDNNFYRAFRLDGLYELEGSDAAPFNIPYTDEGVRLQEANFQPPEAKANEDIQALQLDEDSLSTRVSKYNAIEKEGPLTIFDYRTDQRRVETDAEFQQRLRAESGFKTQEEADQAAREALDLRAKIRDLRSGSEGGGNVPESSKSPTPEVPARNTQVEEESVQDTLRGNFQPAPNKLGLYSQLEKAIEDSPQEKMTISQLRAMLQKSGVKAEELKWSGFDEVLSRGDNDKITKSEALQLAQEGRINIREVIKEGDDTKFSDYQLPGGENYRELLITAPEVGSKMFFYKILDKDGEWIKSLVAKTEEEAVARAKEDYSSGGRMPVSAKKDGVYTGDREGSFKSSHFQEKNILAHVRFNERTGPNGEKILFVEEVQSDLHQKGRKEGYKGEEPKLTEEESKRYDELSDGRKLNDEEYREKLALVEKLDRTSSRVPDAPFKKTWQELSMKRVLRWAAQNDFDKVAWTKGEDQANRYDLSKQIEAVFARKRDDGTFSIMVQEKGKSGITGLSGEAKESDLPNLVGKDLADKIAQQKNDTKPTKYEGVDLKVGGEGMKGFYDKILPQFMDKYGKKWNAKTGEIEIPVNIEADVMNGEEAGSGSIKAHSIDITPEMKGSVMEGQPMFQPAEEIVFPTEAVVGKVKPWLKQALTKVENQLVLADITRDISGVLRDHRKSMEEVTGLKIEIGDEFMNGYWDKDSNPTIPVIIKSDDITGSDGRITDDAHTAISKVGALIGKALYQDAMGYTHGVRDGVNDNAVVMMTKTPLTSNEMRALGAYMDENVGASNHALIQDPNGFLRVLNTSIYSDSPIPLKDFIGHLDKGVKDLGGRRDPEFHTFENDGRLIEDTDYEKTIQSTSEPETTGEGARQREGESSGPIQGQEGSAPRKVSFQDQIRGKSVSSTQKPSIVQLDRNLSRDATNIYKSYQSQLSGGSFQPAADAGGTNPTGERTGLVEGFSSAIPILKGAKPSELPARPTVVEIAKFFQDKVKDPIDYKSSSPEKNKRLVDTLVEEAKHAYELHPEAAGWYNDNIKTTMDVMKELDPDLAKPENDFVFKLLMAATSDGNRVDGQFNQSWKEYSDWKKTGKLSGQHVSGDRVSNIRNNLGMLQTMIESKGLEFTREWMQRKGTVGELRKSLMEDWGWSKDEAFKILNGELVDEVVPFAGVMGPKLGSFFNNLYGDFSSVTMDRWFMRTIGRLTGTSIKPIPEKVMKEARTGLRDAFKALSKEEKKQLGMKTLEFSMDSIDSTSKTLSSRFSDKGLRDVSSEAIHNVRRAANKLFKLLKPVVEAPQNGAHRRWIRERIQEVQKNLKDQNISLENADLQAILWYLEKELYDKLNYRAKEGSSDYASSAAALYEKVAGKPSGVYAGSTGRVGAIGRSRSSETGVQERIQGEETLGDTGSEGVEDSSEGQELGRLSKIKLNRGALAPP